MNDFYSVFICFFHHYEYFLLLTSVFLDRHEDSVCSLVLKNFSDAHSFGFISESLMFLVCEFLFLGQNFIYFIVFYSNNPFFTVIYKTFLFY